MRIPNAEQKRLFETDCEYFAICVRQNLYRLKSKVRAPIILEKSISAQQYSSLSRYCVDAKLYTGYLGAKCLSRP